MLIDLEQALKIVNKHVVSKDQETLFIQAMTFTINRYLLGQIGLDPVSYEDYKNHKDNILKTLVRLKNDIDKCSTDELFIMFQGTRDKFHKTYNGYSEIETVNSIICDLRSSIEKNTKDKKWQKYHGATPKIKERRIFIARVAGIYSLFGGEDSHSEGSIFPRLMQSIFNIVKIEEKPSSLIKRAKEEAYYLHYKAHPFPVSSFYYDLFKVLGTNNP